MKIVRKNNIADRNRESSYGLMPRSRAPLQWHQVKTPLPWGRGLIVIQKSVTVCF